MDFLDRLRGLCLAYPGVYEDYPWGHETPVFKTPANRIVAMSGVGEDGVFRVTLKLTPDESAGALLLPFVRKANYVGRYGWVTAAIASETEWEIVEPWIHRSYELVASGRRKGSPGRTR